jgi:hypothetical protein
MIGVTVFGLLFTPVFYVVIRWLAGDKTQKESSTVPLAEPPKDKQSESFPEGRSSQ